jgi:hypothetical protein
VAPDGGETVSEFCIPRRTGPGEGRSGLLSASGRFGAAQRVGVGDLDLSSRGWKTRDAHLGASQRSAPVS